MSSQTPYFALTVFDVKQPTKDESISFVPEGGSLNWDITYKRLRREVAQKLGIDPDEKYELVYLDEKQRPRVLYVNIDDSRLISETISATKASLPTGSDFFMCALTKGHTLDDAQKALLKAYKDDAEYLARKRGDNVGRVDREREVSPRRGGAAVENGESKDAEDSRKEEAAPTETV